MRANETYSDARRQFSDRNRAVLMNVQSPHRWRSTLNSEVLGSSSSCLRLLVRVMDWCVSRLVRLICCRIILTAGSPGRLLTCRSLAIRLLVLPPLPSGLEKSDICCFTWTLMVALTHWVIRRLVRLGSFPACWRQGNVTPIPKGPPSVVANYRPISITSLLSKVFERQVSVRLG